MLANGQYLSVEIIFQFQVFMASCAKLGVRFVASKLKSYCLSLDKSHPNSEAK
jgi:hypothetical protein